MEHEIGHILIEFSQKLNFKNLNDLINTAEEIKEMHITMDCFDCKASENNFLILKTHLINLEDEHGNVAVVNVKKKFEKVDFVNAENEPGKANSICATDKLEEKHGSLDSTLSEKSCFESKANYINISDVSESCSSSPVTQNQSFSFPKFVLSSESDEEEIVIIRKKKRKSVCVRKHKISSESSQCSSDEDYIGKDNKKTNENDNSDSETQSSQSINSDSSIEIKKNSKIFNEKHDSKQKTDDFESESDFDMFVNQSELSLKNKSNSLFVPVKHDYNHSVLELIDSDYDDNTSVFEIKSPSLINTSSFVNKVSPKLKPVYNICFETPKQTTVPQKKVNSVFKTPKSAVKNIFNQYAFKSVPGTPAYKREFCKVRDQYVSELFTLFNKTVFDNKLPADLPITWNKRMTKTAGFCYYKSSMGVRCSYIELSDKVVDSTDRVRDTLIHELCHAAVWLIDGMKGGHGPRWKYWANKSNRVHSDIPVISRCHQYDINYKYIYKCEGCGVEVGRHSKSVDSNRHTCIRCNGSFILTNSSSTNKRTPNAYANFLKSNFAIVKKNNPLLSHKDLMLKIAEDFHNIKLNNEEN
ncbi:germ cell nuclear acidic protein [Hydra vulgaris]|uniref:Germ cell nuclear acidic protein n=1 Tax=Hydra vulgaris TaxID=6087 RepID=A0ABM4BKK4_HYDVU